MKNHRLFQALITLILLTSLSGVQGQYNASMVESSAAASGASQATAQYAQFYTMNVGSAPGAHVGAPQQYDMTATMPNTVYFGNQMQSVPFSQYQSNPTYGVSNSLWIKGATAWSQYAVVPIGSNVPLLAISSTGGGSGLLNIMDSNGQTYSYNYFFYPNSELSFYADTPGRHTLSFVIGGVTSNTVVIDVAGTITMTYNPAGSYYPPTSNYPGYYKDPQSALDLADANKAYQKWLINNYYRPGVGYNGSDWLGGNNYIVRYTMA